jgi:hypothetical protein
VEPTAADLIAARRDRSGPSNSPLRSSSSRSFRLGTFPVRNKTGSRTFVRTLRLNNSSRSGSVLRWCSAVRRLWRTGPKRSAADLARPVRKAANHVETAAAEAVVIAAEAAVTEAVANRVETAVAITAAIAEQLKVFFPQEGPVADPLRRAIFLADGFHQFGISYW